MGSYHHGDLRKALIEAGQRAIHQRGEHALSLRKLASEVGVSHTALYRHFPNKQALLGGIAARGFGALAQRTRQASEAADDREQSLVAAGQAYVAFALEQPAAFRVMFRAHPDPSPELQRAAEASFEVLLDVVRQGQHAGVVRAGDLRELALVAWASAHGLASLLVDDALPPGLQHPPLSPASIGRQAVTGLLRRT